jgi:predicted enzyme related to lactoylglutathione lyase
MEITTTQPDGTPVWIDLGIPDIDRAIAFYGAVLGWEFERGTEEMGYYTMCLLRGRPVAALSQPPGVGPEHWWTMYFATEDVDGHVKRAADAGGTIVMPAMDIMTQGRMALVQDPVGAQFGLWQGRDHIGAGLVNEPGALLRNDLFTPDPATARDFYAALFDYSLDRNADMPDVDFTFLRRPDGHEIGGIIGAPSATASKWTTLFMVDSADATISAATAAGGTCLNVENTVYGRMAVLTDPFGAEFSVGSQS